MECFLKAITGCDFLNFLLQIPQWIILLSWSINNQNVSIVCPPPSPGTHKLFPSCTELENGLFEKFQWIAESLDWDITSLITISSNVWYVLMDKLLSLKVKSLIFYVSVISAAYSIVIVLLFIAFCGDSMTRMLGQPAISQEQLAECWIILSNTTNFTVHCIT